MTIDEQEQELIEEIDFFNHNVLWWSNEFARVSNLITKIERNNYEGPSDGEMDQLVAQITYLAGKANTEKKTATQIENKVKKLNLRKELLFIQGEPDDAKKRKRRRK